MLNSDLATRLDAIRAGSELPARSVEAFGEFIASAPDEELFRISPIRYAERSGISEQEAIDLFLHATHAGILEFAWGVLCPGCVAFLTTPGGLRSLNQQKRCNFCEITIKGSVDEKVEVGFTVAPSVRRIRFHSPESLDLRKDGATLFFSSSIAPESAYHRALRSRLWTAGRAAPDEAREEEATLKLGRYSLIVPASHAVLHIKVREGAASQVISVELLDGQTIPSSTEVGPGRVTLRILNRTPRPVGYLGVPHSIKGDTEMSYEHKIRPYLTGPRIISSQVFRDLFRSESIPSEGGLELKSVTVLFTDLKGSTAIYERVGDLRAYDLVRKHFALLRDIAASNGGAVVKTIGDAIMASFAEPASAMVAAAKMSREVARVGDGDLLLKVGLHTGPCIAVELNDRLDYFGRTVNIAARVQGVAGAGEIVCTEPVLDSPGVLSAVGALGLRIERTTVELKGISGAVPVVRLH